MRDFSVVRVKNPLLETARGAGVAVEDPTRCIHAARFGNDERLEEAAVVASDQIAFADRLRHLLAVGRQIDDDVPAARKGIDLKLRKITRPCTDAELALKAYRASVLDRKLLECIDKAVLFNLELCSGAELEVCARHIERIVRAARDRKADARFEAERALKYVRIVPVRGKSEILEAARIGAEHFERAAAHKGVVDRPVCRRILLAQRECRSGIEIDDAGTEQVVGRSIRAARDRRACIVAEKPRAGERIVSRPRNSDGAAFDLHRTRTGEGRRKSTRRTAYNERAGRKIRRRFVAEAFGAVEHEHVTVREYHRTGEARNGILGAIGAGNKRLVEFVPGDAERQRAAAAKRMSVRRMDGPGRLVIPVEIHISAVAHLKIGGEAKATVRTKRDAPGRHLRDARVVVFVRDENVAARIGDVAAAASDRFVIGDVDR